MFSFEKGVLLQHKKKTLRNDAKDCHVTNFSIFFTRRKLFAGSILKEGGFCSDVPKTMYIYLSDSDSPLDLCLCVFVGDFIIQKKTK